MAHETAPADERLSNVHSVIVKLTNRCNIRCAYCYENIVARGQDMSSATYQSLVRSLFAASSHRELLIVLHGGEPTLLPHDWFAENLQFTYAEAARWGKRAKVSVQTNLIKIEDQKLALFRQFEVRLGGSLDNPDDLPDAQRPFARQALATFHRARALGVPVGIISTINTSNAGAMRGVCVWLHRELGIQHFKANAAYSVGMGVGLPPIAAHSLLDARLDILRYMIETGGAFIEDNLAHELIRFFEAEVAGRPRQPSLCGDQRCGAGSQVIGVTPAGELLPCGRFQWDDAAYSLGHLGDVSPASVLHFKRSRDAFHTAQPENWHACGTCRAREVCGYGCQAFIVRSRKKVNGECAPTLALFDWMVDHRDDLQPVYESSCRFLGRRALSPTEQAVERLRHGLDDSSWQNFKAQLQNATTVSS